MDRVISVQNRHNNYHNAFGRVRMRISRDILSCESLLSSMKMMIVVLVLEGKRQRLPASRRQIERSLS